MEKISDTTSSGEKYELRIENEKIILELLEYKLQFEPQLIMKDGKLSFFGQVMFHERAREIVISGSSETVRWYEKAQASLNS